LCAALHPSDWENAKSTSDLIECSYLSGQAYTADFEHGPTQVRRDVGSKLNYSVVNDELLRRKTNKINF
jgi:hypothetical protein